MPPEPGRTRLLRRQPRLGPPEQSRSPQRVPAVQDQVVAGHVGGRVGRQQHGGRLQVRHLRQARRRDLRQPLLGQRAQRLRLLPKSGLCQGTRGLSKDPARIYASHSLGQRAQRLRVLLMTRVCQGYGSTKTPSQDLHQPSLPSERSISMSC